MRKLAKPSDNPTDVFSACITNVSDPILKKRLTAVTSKIGASAQAFETAAQGAVLHTLQHQTKVGRHVTAKHMSAVYTQRMAKKGAPGRQLYDQLLAAPSHGTCPLCGHRVVSTLDHHLPKSCFPALAVVPINLVPACADCNKAKLNTTPRRAQEQTLHPYFDDVEDERWLYASVVETPPAALTFCVRAPASWDAITQARLHHHFKTFKLAPLYAANAANELSNIQYQLANVLSAAGAQAVQQLLTEQALSSEHYHLNSWRSAAYRALADSSWYCNGGLNG